MGSEHITGNYTPRPFKSLRRCVSCGVTFWSRLPPEKHFICDKAGCHEKRRKWLLAVRAARKRKADKAA